MRYISIAEVESTTVPTFMRNRTEHPWVTGLLEREIHRSRAVSRPAGVGVALAIELFGLSKHQEEEGDASAMPSAEVVE